MTDGCPPDSFSASSSASSSSSPTPLSTNCWSSLESVPGGTAPYIIWKHHLESDGQSGSGGPSGTDLEIFTALFLKAKPGKPLDFVPCPWKCGCHHKVVPLDNGTLAGICQCARGRALPEVIIPSKAATVSTNI